MVEIDHEGSHKRGGRNVKKGRRRIERGGDCEERKWLRRTTKPSRRGKMKRI